MPVLFRAAWRASAHMGIGWRIKPRHFPSLPNALFSSPPGRWLRGQLEPWQVLRLAEEARLFPLLEPGQETHRKLVPPGALVFAARAHLRGLDALSKITVGSSLICDTEVVDMGRTSFVLRHHLRTDLAQVDEAAILDVQLVTVDGTTHRPVAHLAASQAVPKQERFPTWGMEDGSLAHEERVLVRPSDCDAYGHANNASFVQYVCDAARSAVDEARLKAWGSGGCWFDMSLVDLSVSWLAQARRRQELLVQVHQLSSVEDAQTGSKVTIGCEIVTCEKCPVPVFRARLCFLANSI